ncbi:MAG: hypothetical protein DA394_05110, partial [Candidatus Arcticimaribacter sp.]
ILDNSILGLIVQLSNLCSLFFDFTDYLTTNTDAKVGSYGCLDLAIAKASGQLQLGLVFKIPLLHNSLIQFATSHLLTF